MYVLKRGQVPGHISNTAVGQLSSAPWMLGLLPSLSFSVLQALLILSAVQPAIFSVLANSGQIACSPPFSSKIRSQGEHIRAPVPGQDGQDGEVREERTLEQKVGQPASENLEYSDQKGTSKKSS